MINLDEINNSLPKGYSLKEQQGHYLLRRYITGDIPVYYKKDKFSANQNLLNALKEVILKHEKRKSSTRLKSRNEPSQKEKTDLDQRLKESGLSVLE